MKVLVLDGNENQAVASVRSLGEAGHSVEVGSSVSWSKAGWSRFAAGTFSYPAPDENLAGFVERITAKVKEHGNTLVLPMTEQTTLPLSQHRKAIEEAGGHLVLPPHETVCNAFDKKFTSELASSLGVATPRTVLLDHEADPRSIAGTLGYPVVLKPRSSQEISASSEVRKTGAPLYARNETEFLDAVTEMRERCSEMLVQEYVTGAGAGYFALMRQGELRAEFAHRRIRDVRPTGSGSSVRISTPVSPAVREAALPILQALKWHGVAMVEFRMRGDTPVFMEVNGRFWNSLALAIYSGVDFPALLVSMFEHGDVAPQEGYQVGVSCRWFLGDFRHLIEVWRGAPKGYAGTFPRRWSTLGNFLRPVAGMFHDNFRWSDPLPELGDWIDFISHRLPRHLKKADGSRSRLGVQGNYSRT